MRSFSQNIHQRFVALLSAVIFNTLDSKNSLINNLLLLFFSVPEVGIEQNRC